MAPRHLSEESPKELLRNFETFLVEKLTQLLLRADGSLSWICQALEVVSMAYEKLNSLVTSLHLPAKHWEHKWVDEYFKESLNVLDICNTIKSQVYALDQKQLEAKYLLYMFQPSVEKFYKSKNERRKNAEKALKPLMEVKQGGGGEAADAPKTKKGIEVLLNMRSSMQVPKSKSSSNEGAFQQAMYAAKAVSILICGVIVAVFSSTSPEPLILINVPDSFSWSRPFSALQQKIREVGRSLHTSKGSPILIKELQDLKSKALNLQSSLMCEDQGEEADVEIAVQELQQNVEFLSQGCSALSKQVQQCFHVLLSGRDALLALIRGA